MIANRQPQWTIYEAVLLLEALLETHKKVRPRSHIIKEVSVALRQMAVNQQLEIDDVYRNENGISYQLQSMESAFRGKRIYVPATKLFNEVVALYKEDQNRFDSLLEEAHKMIEQLNNREEFLSWALTTVPEKQYKCLDDNVLYAEQYARSKGLISKSIYAVSDRSTLLKIQKAVNKNKFYHIRQRKLPQDISDAIDIYISFCSSRNSKNGEETSTISYKEPVSTFVNRANGYDSVEKEEIQRILVEHYQYGFRYESIREIIRFRQYAETMGVELPNDDDLLREAIISSGTVIEDKVFCKSAHLPEELQRIVDEVYATGVETIYYECLFQNESEWMEIHTILSEEMLKEYLKRYVKGWAFAKKFMLKDIRKTEKQAVTEEIKRVWGETRIENVDDLSKRLPYIPLGNIWRVISGNDSFVLSSEGEYLLVDRFIISQDEIDKIVDYVYTSCETKGFCSLPDVPLGDIEENNYDLSTLAIYNAIYKVVLADKYYLNGKILTRDKPELDAVLLLKQSIIGKKECSFDEVAEKVIELTGGTNRQYAFRALYDEMVRVDKNRFVSDDTVTFEINEIDKVLSTFVKDHFVAIRDITTFAMFPICGQNWNHYLLESFCYKFSRKYCLHVIHFNDKNAGIIAESDFYKTYSEMLAIELVRSDVDLHPETAGMHLFNTGYLAKSKYAKLDDIVQRAIELRMEGH